MMHYLYKITRLDGKFYIGMRSNVSADTDCYMGSGRLITKSVRAHGAAAHTKEILGYYPTREALSEAEAELVTAEMLKDTNCLNLCLGGRGGYVLSERAKAKFTFAGRTHSTDTKAAISKAASGRIFSNSHKQNLSTSRKNIVGWNHSEETKNKIRQKNLGHTLGEIGRDKIKIANSKPCTIDGFTIFSSKTEMQKALGSGSKGTRASSFRYVEQNK